LLFLGTSFGFVSTVKTNEWIEKIPIIIRPNQEVLNEKNLRNKIKELHLKYEDVIVAQYIIESGAGTSNIYKQNNNFLGLKEPHSRPTTSLGTNLGSSIFEDWEQCLIDYSLWQTMCARGINSQEEYIQLLGSIYAEDQSYMDKINNILNKK
jgi:flagellum-specific peptidoglycan hydrolase FlgJ